MQRILVALAATVAALTLASSAFAATLATNCHPGETAWAVFAVLPGPVTASAVDFNYLTAGRRPWTIGLSACPALSGGCTGGVQHGAVYPWGTISLSIHANGAKFIHGGCINPFDPTDPLDTFDVTPF